MKRILFSILFLFINAPLMLMAEVQVIQVRRNIPLSDEDLVFKDYYLSGGSKAGIRLNLIMQVFRWVNLRENNQAQDQSMKILEPVGWLKVIFVQEQIAVARLYEVTDFINQPILEQPGIMMGDIVSFEHSYIAKQPQKMPKDSSQVSPLKEESNQKSPTSEVNH